MANMKKNRFSDEDCVIKISINKPIILVFDVLEINRFQEIDRNI